MSKKLVHLFLQWCELKQGRTETGEVQKVGTAGNFVKTCLGHHNVCTTAGYKIAYKNGCHCKTPNPFEKNSHCLGEVSFTESCSSQSGTVGLPLHVSLASWPT